MSSSDSLALFKRAHGTHIVARIRIKAETRIAEKNLRAGSCLTHVATLVLKANRFYFRIAVMKPMA